MTPAEIERTRTVAEKVRAYLAEINPRVLVALEAAGTDANGRPLPGYLGWLPAADLNDLARAWCMGWEIGLEPADIEAAAANFRASVWDKPRGERDFATTMATVQAWCEAQNYTEEQEGGARLLVACGMGIT